MMPFRATDPAWRSPWLLDMTDPGPRPRHRGTSDVGMLAQRCRVVKTGVCGKMSIEADGRNGGRREPPLDQARGKQSREGRRGRPKSSADKRRWTRIAACGGNGRAFGEPPPPRLRGPGEPKSRKPRVGGNGGRGGADLPASGGLRRWGAWGLKPAKRRNRPFLPP